MADEARILQLIIDYLQGTLSASDKEELDTWINASPANRRYMENRVTLAAIEEDLQILSEMDERALDEKVWAGIMAEASESSEPAAAAGPPLPVLSPTVSFRGRITKWFLYIASGFAAAFLVWTFAPQLYNYFSGRKTDPRFSTFRRMIWDSTLLVRQQDAKTPMLFIAEDRYILLESSPEGRLTKQGSLVIVKRGREIAFIYSKLKLNTAENPPLDSAIDAICLPPDAASYDIILPDSSIIGLAPGSTLKFKIYFLPYQPPRRMVALIGKATFTVAHNKAPFTVETSQLEMTAKGTQFHVTDPGNKETYSILQYSGKLEVTDGRQRKELDSAERAIFDHRHPGMKIETHVSLPPQKNKPPGNFDFSHSNLTSALNELARYYGIPHIQIVGPVDTITLGKLSLGQVPKNLPLSQVLETLEKQTNDMQFSADDEFIRVTKQSSSGPEQTR